MERKVNRGKRRSGKDGLGCDDQELRLWPHQRLLPNELSLLIQLLAKRACPARRVTGGIKIKP